MKEYNIFISNGKEMKAILCEKIEQLTEIIKLEIENTKELEIIIKEISEEQINEYKKSE